MLNLLRSIFTDSARSDMLLKTNVTSVPIADCNSTLLAYNKDKDAKSLRNGLQMTQLCANDPMARNDACQGKWSSLIWAKIHLLYAFNANLLLCRRQRRSTPDIFVKGLVNGGRRRVIRYCMRHRIAEHLYAGRRVFGLDRANCVAGHVNSDRCHHLDILRSGREYLHDELFFKL